MTAATAATSAPAVTVDTSGSGAALPLMLTELRLPTIKRLWPELAAQSNREGWPAERLLHTLLGYEMAERETRRLVRARADSQLPPGKSLDLFDFAAVPAVSKAHVMALAEADSWIAQGHNLLAFGPPGTGKTHLLAAIGHALIDRGLKVRAGPRNSDTRIGEVSAPIGGESRLDRSIDDETTPQEPLSRLQGEGGRGRREGRAHAGAAG